MTYQSLLTELLKLNQDQLNRTVTIYDTENEEHYPVIDDIAFTTEECNVLDPDSPILYI